MKRSSKSIKKIYIIQFAVGGVLLLVLMVLLVVYKGGLQSYEPKEETVQYIAGEELKRSENAVYSIKDDAIIVKDGEGENSLDAVPIIHKNESRKVTLTENMMYSDPKFGDGGSRLNYFTNISIEDGLMVIEKDGKNAIVAGGYLFNGKDTYIFLEDVTLRAGANKEVIPALSVLTVRYRDEIELYNSKTQKFSYYVLNGMDSIVNVDDEYEIDLGRDVLFKNSKEHLIYSAVDGLDVMKLE